MIRYHRMKGDPTLWLPGTDHASIATEVKIVDALKKEGLTKKDLGREEFLRSRLAMARAVRPPHREPAAQAGRFLRLDARALHHGRRDSTAR